MSLMLLTLIGLLCYWFGSPISSAPTSESSSQDEDLVGRNLATCIWESRASALLAMRGEKHKVAAQLASVRPLSLARGIPHFVLTIPKRDPEEL